MKIKVSKKKDNKINKNLIVVYTSIGAILVILGVYTAPVSANASESNITAVQLPLISKVIDEMNVPLDEIKEIDDSAEGKAALRVEKILAGINEGKINERQAEILNVLEDLAPLESNTQLVTTLSEMYSVTKDEVTSLESTLTELGVDLSWYV